MEFAEKVELLQKPETYDVPVDLIAVRETHTAMVFLTADHAYKLKKPVRLPYLDFSTLKARRHFCEEEVRLNRELAGDIYIRTRPLAPDKSNRVCIGGTGRAIDWLVEMLRLPEDDMLDRRLATHAHVSIGEIQTLADHLADFYRRQQLRQRNGDAYLGHLLRESTTNREHLQDMRRHLDGAYSDELVSGAVQSVEEHVPEIKDRIAKSLVVEGHGDLRAEHVCLLPVPVVFDRLEFDASMLFVDIYDEINYLGLECDWLGAGWIRGVLLRRMENMIGFPPSAGLLSAYGCFRLLLRARLSIDHLLDRHPRTPEKWPIQAKRYLRAASGLATSTISLPAKI